MGYYHFLLDDLAKSLTAISLPWGNYHYNRLPMGIMTAVDIFQREMSILFHDMPFVKIYLDDILIISYNNVLDHLDKLAQALQRLLEANLKVKIQKCEFLQKEVEYLGFNISNKGIYPIKEKIDGIVNLSPPTSRK